VALEEVLAIQAEVNAAASAQGRPLLDILNMEEEARIRELVAAGTWPNRWAGDEPGAEEDFEETFADGSAQPNLFGLEEWT
jgi:DNA sulfur modification protein DndC